MRQCLLACMQLDGPLSVNDHQAACRQVRSGKDVPSAGQHRSDENGSICQQPQHKGTHLIVGHDMCLECGSTSCAFAQFTYGGTVTH